MSDKTITLPAALELSALNKAIDSCNKRAASLMNDYQDVAVQALMRLAEHGDVGPINRILAGMPKGAKTNSMASWALAHGAVEVNTDAATKKSMPLRFTKAKATNVEAAIEDKWFDHMPEKAIDDVFDLSKAIAVIIAKAKGKQVKLGGAVMTGEETAKMLSALEAFGK